MELVEKKIEINIVALPKKSIVPFFSNLGTFSHFRQFMF